MHQMQTHQLLGAQKRSQSGAENFVNQILQVVQKKPSAQRTEKDVMLRRPSCGLLGVSSNGKTLVSKTSYPGSNPGTPVCKDNHYLRGYFNGGK